MKNSFNKTHAIILLIASMSLTLVGCGTGADNSSMSADNAAMSVQSALAIFK